MSGYNRDHFVSLFGEGTHFVNGDPAVNPAPPASRELLRNINIQIKEGFGLSGNESGGAHPGTLNIGIAAAAQLNESAGLPSGEDEEGGEELPDATGGAYEDVNTGGGTGGNWGTPVPGTGPGVVGGLGPDPDLLNLWNSGELR